MTVRTVALDARTGADGAAFDVPPGFRAGISLLGAGDMALSKRALLPHRARFVEALGLGPRAVYALRQVHSRTVLVVDGRAPSELVAVEADGMASASDRALLAVTVADCLPIFLFDPGRGVFALVHSGWKGTGIAGEAVRCLADTWGSGAGDLSALVGPGIGPCCYEVPEDRAAGFAREFGEASVVRGQGQPRLDLRAANLALLERAGVRGVTVVGDCTACSARLGSYRRQGPAAYSLMMAWCCRAAED